MGGIAASGGYYVSMANRGADDVIFAEPATLTGSIGVIIPHFDISQALRRYDIRDDSIASGPLKEMLSLTKDRTPELAEKERKLLQELVDDMFRRFKEIVKAGRPKLDDDAVDRVATGQVFTARQALEAGLVDRIGFLEEAIDRAVELAGLSPETARAVKYSKPKGLLDEVLGGIGRTGRWFAHQWAGVVPDVMPLAKGLGSGVPIGAVVTGPKASGVLGPGNHGTTFGGNPLAMRAGVETLRIMREDGLLEHAASVGARLKAGLERELGGLSGVKEIRGAGLMLGVELDRPCGVLLSRAAQAGLLISVTADSVIRLVPPLILSPEEADEIVARLAPLVQAFLAEPAA
jgi:signal peptide peptidase SppA